MEWFFIFFILIPLSAGLLVITLISIFSNLLQSSFKTKFHPYTNSGERKVRSILYSLPITDFYVLNDLMFSHNGHTCQIDHILVSTLGIFVIETKSHEGIIICNPEKEFWTQILWRTKYKFYNPTIQNENHIKFLIRKFPELRFYSSYIYPIVVFTHSTELKLTAPCDYVLEKHNLSSYILSKGATVLSVEQINSILELLNTNNITDNIQREGHIYNVRKAIKYKQETIYNNICPRCGGSLITRNGKYGTFLGCSNYPSCHFTIKTNIIDYR